MARLVTSEFTHHRCRLGIPDRIDIFCKNFPVLRMSHRGDGFDGTASATAQLNEITPISERHGLISAAISKGKFLICVESERAKETRFECVVTGSTAPSLTRRSVDHTPNATGGDGRLGSTCKRFARMVRRTPNCRRFRRVLGQQRCANHGQSQGDHAAWTACAAPTSFAARGGPKADNALTLILLPWLGADH